MAPRFRFSITLKLLSWCLALIAIFYITTVYLFINTRNIVSTSSEIVDVHFLIDSTAKRMIERLISLEENMKRYEILQNEDYRGLILQDVTEFRDLLASILQNLPQSGEPWVTVIDEFNQIARHSARSGEITLSYTKVNGWLQLLTRTRQANQQLMEGKLMDMHARGRQAIQIGFIGLSMSVLLGLAGSLLVALRLNSSLRELRRGIRDLSRSADIKPLKVASRDELGDLANAFNNMAERLKLEEEMRSDFISMLSHEVRTPLTSIRESVDMVADGLFGEVNEQQKEFLDLSRREIDRLSRLLKRLMQASSLEKGHIVVEPKPSDPAEIVTAARERLWGAAKAKNIQLHSRLAGNAPPVMADFENVLQVLANLLSNAIKFSPEGTEVALEVQLDGKGKRLVFSVQDDGPGIPEEDQPFVFQKYYRGAQTRQSVDGAGLGLSISKSIVEAHGGEMWLESNPGQGSRFCFTLPLADAIG